MQCAESLRVQAYFDGELDALSAADIERHSGTCAECSALLDDIKQTRAALRHDLGYESTPPELRARVMRALDQEIEAKLPRLQRQRITGRRLRPFWQVRALMPDHLIDVVSTDKHTVKPWFAGHTDVSPVVADFDQQGYRLIGGRADYFDHQRAAVVVYQHGSHVINVFSWAATTGSVPKDTTRNGYHLAFWKTGDLVYCAVSDTAWDELLGLVRLLQDMSTRDAS